VRGDFKSGRVKDPSTPVSSKHEKVIKVFVKDFMDKAAKKKMERDNGKAARTDSSAKDDAATRTTETDTPETPRPGDETLHPSDTEHSKSHDVSPAESYLKRKREGNDSPTSPKKSRTERVPAPPPPPPPPADDMPGLDGTSLTPQYDEPNSFHSMSDKEGSSVAINGKSRLQQDDVMQLATPPTNGHTEYTNGRNSTKHALATRGRP
jgi:hypothetical protein